jgi:hypothetical protein
MITTAVRLSLPVALVAALSLAIAACSSAAAPGGAASPQPVQSPSASAAPSEPAGASPTNPDTPIGAPSDPAGGGGIGGGGIGGGAAIVMPQPGMINPHPVAVEKIETAVDGHHVTAKLTWTSGVKPCNVLDSVVVSRDGNDIALTVVEGSADQTAICIEIAQTKATIVDLGELDPGTYSVSATDSQIPPVTLTVV